MRKIVIIVFFQIHISDGVFVVRRVTFLEKFYLLCNLFSYRGKNHSGVVQTLGLTGGKNLVILFYLCFVDELFLQCFRYFYKISIGCKTFCLIYFDLVRAC